MQQKNGIDKNQILGFVFLTLFLFGVMFYFQNKQENAEPTTTEQPSQANTNKNLATNISSTANTTEIKNVSLKNEKISVEFNSLGGQVSSVMMNQYKAYNPKTNRDDLPLYLINNRNSSYGFEFKDKTGKVISTKNLVFVPTVEGNTVTMSAQLNNGASIKYTYILKDYQIDFKVSTQNLGTISGNDTANFAWEYSPKEAEKGRDQEQQHTEFVYAFDNYKSTDYDARTTLEEPKETLNWLAIKQQFFAPIIEAKGGFKNSMGSQEAIESGEYLKKFNFNGQIDLSTGELNENLTWYFLPLELDLLKSYNKNFDEILPLGWSFIGSMNRWIFIPMYNMISSWGIAAGWVIFLMTIFVKIVLSPIMYKQHKLSAMMRVIRPEIDEVNAKFKDADPMKRQQEIMSVYSKAGVNQLAGCLPALLQIPIFYALFRFFPNMLDLRGKSFWFATDLTAYDDVIKLPFSIPLLGDHLSIFALACTAVILIYTMMTAGNMQQPTQEGMPNMKPLMYIFPIMFLFFLNSAASGLSWYYFVSNAINIVIILVIKYIILDEKTIHAQIQANKAKPKKEGKFQKRMREMMEKAQEQQKLMEQQKKNRNK